MEEITENKSIVKDEHDRDRVSKIYSAIIMLSSFVAGVASFVSVLCYIFS